MPCIARFIINFLIFPAIVILLAACASGPSADPPVCRGTAFSINAATPLQTSGAP